MVINPRNKENWETGQPIQPENMRGRQGGDDSLADSSPSDNRSDEKVIVNEQRGNKTVNAPPQTAANTSEENSYDDEIIDDSGDTDE